MTHRTLKEVAMDALKKCPLNSGFEINDKVTFTNDYGIEFTGHKIIGFTNQTYAGGGSIYIDYDCYWHPCRPDQLKKEQTK